MALGSAQGGTKHRSNLTNVNFARTREGRAESTPSRDDLTAFVGRAEQQSDKGSNRHAQSSGASPVAGVGRRYRSGVGHVGYLSSCGCAAGNHASQIASLKAGINVHDGNVCRATVEHP